MPASQLKEETQPEPTPAVSEVKISNAEFMVELFGSIPAEHHCWTTSFATSPKQQAGGEWVGRHCAPESVADAPYGNAYMSVATFKRGRNNSLRRDTAHFAALHLVVLDDTAHSMIQPTYKLETSLGNYQLGFKLREPITDVGVASRLVQSLANASLVKPDSSGNNAVRFVRLPAAINTKTNPPFKCNLHKFDPANTYTLDELIDAFGLDRDIILHGRDRVRSNIKVGHGTPWVSDDYLASDQPDDCQLADLESAIDYLCGTLFADDRDNWIKIGLALRTYIRGRGLWLKLSASSGKFRPDVDPQNWETFRPATAHWKQVFKFAQGMGWQNPCTPSSEALATTEALLESMTVTIRMTEGQNPRDFAELMFAAEAMTSETDPGEIESIVTETARLTAVERRRIWKALKSATGLPFSVFEEHLNDTCDSETDCDHLVLANKVIESVGGDNILTSGAFLYLWKDRGFWQRLDERPVKQLVQTVLTLNKSDIFAAKITGVVDVLKNETYRHEHQFNVGPAETVNCVNGEVTLVNGNWILLPANREHYRTTQIPVEFDPKAIAPQFMKFMQDLFAGDPDASAKCRALMEMLGYTLMAHTRHERFVILVGNGANGKSVFLYLVEALCGSENIAAVQPSKLDRSFMRAHLFGKLANIVTEIKQGETIDDASLKGIVSGEPTTVEFKFHDAFNMRPFSTCWFGTNHMPHTRDFSDALFRRALIVKFNNVFKPEKGNADPMLKEKLAGELPGILNLALNAYADGIRDGFTMPKSCIEAREEWRLETDLVAQFVDAVCVKEIGASIAFGDLYREFQAWAAENCVQLKLTEKLFRDRLTKLGCGTNRTAQARMVTGLRLLPKVNLYAAGFTGRRG